MRHVLSAVVQNVPGVLAHISGMLASRGYNIDSLAVGETEDPELLADDVRRRRRRPRAGAGPQAARKDRHRRPGRRHQLAGLRRARPDADQGRRAAGGGRSEIRELAEIFRGRIVDVAPREVMVEISGQERKIEAFIDLMRPYGIVELVRTGRIAMVRGGKQLRRAAARRGRQPRRRRAKSSASRSRDLADPLLTTHHSPPNAGPMPAKIYYDNDADLSLLKGKTIAILGYGSQGHAQAQNLRDSGCTVIIGQRPGGPNYDLAVSHGFKPMSRRRRDEAGRHRQHPAARRSAGRHLSPARQAEPRSRATS